MSNAQTVENINFEQVGNQIYIYYDLNGFSDGQKGSIDIFYTIDNGKSWLGPIKKISGKLTDIVKSSFDNLVIWDVLEEASELVGELQFKVELTVVESKFLGSSGEINDSRDNKTYKSQRVGDYIWMTENLNHNIPGKSWCFNDEEKNSVSMGRLYTYEVALQACPDGWHLPSDTEWKNFEREFGMTLTEIDKIGSRVLDHKAKSKIEDSHFIDSYDGYYQDGYKLGGVAIAFWTGTKSSEDDYVMYRLFNNYSDGIIRFSIKEDARLYIRCVTTDK